MFQINILSLELMKVRNLIDPQQMEGTREPDEEKNKRENL